MTYGEMLKVTRKGKLGKLPNFIGYFKWNFVENDMIFYNGGTFNARLPILIYSTEQISTT